MKKVLCTFLIGVAFAANTRAAEVIINGAGATFPYPIYSKWFDRYHQQNPDIVINYQAIGSGGGIRQFTSKTVDFGATDGPMNEKQLSAVEGKAIHIPTVLGGVVPAFNVPGVSDINFTGPILADIYLGKITQWNDPALISINTNVKLPAAPITVVHRADGSGTTYCWTDYLSKVSPEWKSKVGVGVSVNWPVGLGGKGNEGVAGNIKQIANSIGYIELVYAKQNRIPFGSVKNQEGNFVKATLDTITAAADSVNMPKDYRVSITNAPGVNAYPVSTFTWLLLYEKNSGETGKVMKEFLEWALSDGQQNMSIELGYAPLPQKVREMVRSTITSIQ